MAQDGIFSDKISSMNMERPRLTPFLPEWDLGIVLEALAPYEPNSTGDPSIKHLPIRQSFPPGHGFSWKT